MILKFYTPDLYQPIHHLFSSHSQFVLFPGSGVLTISFLYTNLEKNPWSIIRDLSLFSAPSLRHWNNWFTTKPLILSGKFISYSQFGFLPNRSALQQLLTMLNPIVQAVNCYNQVDCLYLDLKKVFDSVSHVELLTKLWRADITAIFGSGFLHT